MKRLCPICNQNEISYYAKQCRPCYLTSDEFLTRVRNQAVKANLAANESRWGEKQRNDWKFTVISPELAYVIGVYLTDGWMNIKRHTFGLDVTSESFSNYFRKCVSQLGLETKTRIRTKHGDGHKGTKPMYRTSFYSRTLCEWLDGNCQNKETIPTCIMDAPLECQIAFISGAVDGDGMVSNENGSVSIYGSKSWMSQLPLLLSLMGIRTGGYRYIKTLPSGKNYYAVSVHRQDFIDKGGFSGIDYKQSNLDNRPISLHQQKRDTCPTCGKLKSVRSNQCRACWRSDEKQLNHLRRISPLGNAAKKA